MAKTVFENEEVKNLPRVKQMVRKFSSFASPGSDAVLDVDNELSSWINNGWKLFATHYMGNDPEGVSIVYILTKD